MEADERATADRNPRRRSGHHVMIASAMVALIMPDRADHGELVERRGQSRHVLGEMDARDFRRDRLKLASDLQRCFGFWIEGLEVCRPTIHPNQNACFRLSRTPRSVGRGCGDTASAQGVGQPAAKQASNSKTQTIAAAKTFTVSRSKHG